MNFAESIKYGLIWFLLFLLSAPVHEAAHAWASKKGGDPTAYLGGQVTLNPLPHMKREPWGMIVIPLITAFTLGWPFGYASAPYDPVWAHKHPRRAAWMAAAGPAANLSIVLICVIIMKVGILAGVFLEPDMVSYTNIVDPSPGTIWAVLSMIISMLFTLNLILFILNIIPLPPLDGSGIIALFLSDEAARKYRSVISNPAFYFLGLAVIWFGFAPLFGYIFPGVINLIYWGANFH
jgi:Zn-dependent protease